MIDGTILAILIVLVPLAWGRARYWKGWHEGRADLMRDLVAEELEAHDHHSRPSEAPLSDFEGEL